MDSAALLSLIVFLPTIAALGFLAVPRDREGFFRTATLVVTGVVFLLSLGLLSGVRADGGFHASVKLPWIPGLGIDYSLGVDGISLFLVLLTTFLTPLVILASTKSIHERVKEFHILMLVLQTGMLGTFLALDLFLFYIFWEVMLIPMYLLIGVWGGKRRIYAAVKFVLYTIVGSLLMLVAIVCLYFDHHAQTGVFTFDLLQLYGTIIDPSRQLWYFAAFALAFAIKVPLFPLHTWLPDAHVEAPTAGSVILAGVLLKMGTYGFLRLALPLFPEAAHTFQPLLLTLAVIGVLYGALVAMVQTDIKKLVAYSSVSHLAYCMLGLFSFGLPGFSGSLYQMISHGLSTGALFLLVGVVYERRHTREISEYGGLAQTMPWFSFVFIFVTLSSIGLPGLNGFVGEFLVLLGIFEANRLAGVLASFGVVLGAVYMLWLAKRFLFGPVTNEANRRIPDLTRREVAVLAPILVLIVVMGVRPQPFLKMMEPSLQRTLSRVAPSSRPSGELPPGRSAPGRSAPGAPAPGQPAPGSPPSRESGGEGDMGLFEPSSIDSLRGASL